nr:hypothetical protein [Tanacetum cinerariifolium]
MRPLFLLENKLGAKALELRRASLALTLLYLASKSLVFLILATQARMKSIKDQVNARNMNRVWAGGYRWKKAADEAKQEAELAKQEAKLANEWAARVELVLDKFMGHYNQQQTQAGGRSFTPPPLPTTLVPETISTSIPDPYSDPNSYYKVMNLGSSRIPNDDEDGDDQDCNDEDGNANNEDGNGSDESLSESVDE